MHSYTVEQSSASHKKTKRKSSVVSGLAMLTTLIPLSLGASQAQSSAISFIGVWAAEREYRPSSTLRDKRDGFAVQPPGGSFSNRLATPLRFEPLRDAEHFFLVVRPAADGTLRAIFRNPEFNIGAFIDSRVLTVDGNIVHLRRAGRKELTGTVVSDTLRFHFENFPGDFVFHRANANNASAYYARPGVTRYTYHIPEGAGDGWRTGTLRSVGINPHPIFDLMNTIINPDTVRIKPYIQSVLIARHGRLVLDEYFYGFDRERPHDVRSAGKSVTTLLLGRAMEDGAPYGTATKIGEIFSNYGTFAHDDERKRRITVGDLMSMDSGLACDDNNDASPGNEGTMQSQTGDPDWYKFTLDLPMEYDPGTHPLYCSAGMNLVGGVLARGTHRWLPAYFDDHFARPMQFKQYSMWLMPPPLSDAYMAGGDYFRPRDFLKFGQLFLNHGSWNGRRIIGDRWLRAVSTKRATIEGEVGDYGYGWHIISYQFHGRMIRAINAGGNGGQLLFVFPRLDLTVMITAGNYGQYQVWSKFITELVPHYILPAVSF